MDTLTKRERSRVMSLIRGKNTKPEMVVRRLLHRLGYRFRLHAARLPGHPDLVFPSRRKAIFVHGCYWHRHRCRRGQSTPTSNAEWWQRKFDRNRDNDRRKRGALRRAGWSVLIVWECEMKDAERLARRLVSFLEGDAISAA